MNTPNVPAGRLERRVRLLKLSIGRMELIAMQYCVENSGWFNDLCLLHSQLKSANNELERHNA